ncbi:MAG: ribosomal subunit interface protein [Flavobacterium sp.]|nr:ribosomal subunit interface protein [Flavobacterium sp.]
MKIIFKGTNLEATEALKNYAMEKISHLSRYWEGILEARIELEKSSHHQKGFFRCEVNLDVPQKHVMRAESINPDLHAAIDEVIPKLREQIEKLKGRQRTKNRRLKRYLKTVFAWRSKNK